MVLMFAKDSMIKPNLKIGDKVRVLQPILRQPFWLPEHQPTLGTIQVIHGPCHQFFMDLFKAVYRTSENWYILRPGSPIWPDISFHESWLELVSNPL